MECNPDNTGPGADPTHKKLGGPSMGSSGDSARRQHDFKIGAVQQVLAGYQHILTEVANTLGVSRFLLWSWTREHRDEAGRAFPTHTRSSGAQVVGRLHQENERLTAENEALRRCLSLRSSSAGEGWAAAVGAKRRAG